MLRRSVVALMALALTLPGCGGGSDSGGGGSFSSGGGTTTPTPTPTPTPSACSLRSRQDWAAAQLREWYLFPETLPTTLDPTPYATVDAYIDALTATARAQRRDRFFTYLTSIAGENAYYNSGSSAGFGIRLSVDPDQRRLFVSEAFEGAPALTAGIDRGAEIVAIGTSATNLRTVSDIFAAEGSDGISNALGPSTTGTSRLLRISDAGGIRNVSVTKTDYTLTPVSSRYGARIIDDGGRRIGYVNLRTFINTAESALRDAFAQFRAAGITDIIVDLRYNGGGLVSTAELLGDLMGRDRFTSEVFDFTTFRSEKSSSNSTRFFAPQSQSVAPTKIAFIGTGGTASASELVINAFIPYLRERAGLIGANTYGKPVGQIALDRAACDDRLRVIAFATQNSARQGNYFDGLAGTVAASCQAADDLSHAMGDAQESSTRQALDFLAGRSCTPIAPPPSTAVAEAAPSATATPTTSSSSTTQTSFRAGPRGERRELLMPTRPNTVQRTVPGIF
ncbi:MAG: peptidase [Rhizorhabdus sp.]|nr:peptidase [Rhizorhabdus sp.]